MKKNSFWKIGESSDFGKIAISYAAGEDVILDKAFVQYECLVNQAHHLMLYKNKLVSKRHTQKIFSVLEKLKKLDKNGKFILSVDLEDVHSNVENFVINTLGIEVGGNYSFGISRNELVYTDTRLFLRDKMLVLMASLIDLIDMLAEVASNHIYTIMPSYEHSRVSQPITYAHWLLAKAYHFLDDAQNLLYDFHQVNKSPLGMFEQAGSHIPLDRDYVAILLGFEGILVNSLYAASTRAEIEAKVLATFCMIAMHMKKTMQEFINWSGSDYGYIQLDDMYVTGATASPSAKNPDTLEVVRANCSKIYGKFLETIIMTDSIPSGYNRDTQQTKPTLFASIALLEQSLQVFGGIVTSATFNIPTGVEKADTNFSTASDLAHQLAIKSDISFREGYMLVKGLIKNGKIQNNFALLTSGDVLQISKEVLGKKVHIAQKDIKEIATAKARVFACKSKGSPSPSSTKLMIKDIKSKATLLKRQVVGIEKNIQIGLNVLEKEVAHILA